MSESLKYFNEKKSCSLFFVRAASAANNNQNFRKKARKDKE